MEKLRVRLETCDPERGRFRSYRLEADTDLFGDWLVDVMYSRIGARGRRICYLASDEALPRPIRARGSGDLAGICAELVRQQIIAAGPYPHDLHGRTIGKVERELIQRVLAHSDRVQIKATALGINRNIL